MPPPHKTKPHHHHEKNRIEKVAVDLAVSGMSSRIYDVLKTPEEISKFCIDVATRIIDQDIDGDADSD